MRIFLIAATTAMCTAVDLESETGTKGIFAQRYTEYVDDTGFVLAENGKKVGKKEYADPNAV